MRASSRLVRGVTVILAAACLVWPASIGAAVSLAPVAPPGIHTTVILATQNGDRVSIVGTLVSPHPKGVDVAVMGGGDRGLVWRTYRIPDTGRRPLAFSIDIPAPKVDGAPVTLLARAVDASGVDPAPAFASVRIDTVPPRIRALEVNGGRPAVRSDSVRLFADVPGAATMRIARDPKALEFAPWLPYKRRIVATVARQEGTQRLIAQFADAKGNMTAPSDGEMTIVVDMTPPRMVGVSVVDGRLQATFDEPVLLDRTTGLKLDGAPLGPGTASTMVSRTLVLPSPRLRVGTTHILAVKANSGVVDLAGNAALGTSESFFVPDTSPPTAPRALDITSSASVVTLDWPPGRDNVAVVAYDVYRSVSPLPPHPGENALVSRISGGRFIDDGAVSGGAYYYAVAAVDEAGNVSAISPQAKVSVVAAADYHGGEGNTTNLCKDCHQSDNSQGPSISQQRMKCYSCHDGTGSHFNVKAEFSEDSSGPSVGSAHPVKAGTLSCVDCHSPHKSAATDPGLLSVLAGDDSRVFGGTRFCLVCHSELPASDRRASGARVDAAAFLQSDHASLPVVDAAGVACAACHKSHASSQAMLLDQPEKDLCLSCHGSGARGPLGWDVAGQFSGASYHSLDGSTTDGLTGAVLRCSSCHGPHSVQRGAPGLSDLASRVVDPADPSHSWSAADGTVTDFCLRCHRSTASGSGISTAGVSFPIVDTVSYPFFSGWDKSGFVAGAHAQTATAGGAERTCASCHQPHGSDNPRLLSRAEDTTSSAGLCLGCHDGSGGTSDIRSALSKPSHHPTLEQTGVHRDLEGPVELGYNGGAPDMRHAECQDCHDAHLAQQGRRPAGSPAAAPAINGVVGVTADRWPDSSMGGPTGADFHVIRLQAGVSEEWQLCFKCHSRYTSLPATDAAGLPARDIAAEFNPHNPSFHPAVVASKGTTADGFVPGSSWGPGSRMACTDCHGNDDTGTAASVGPHGSRNPGILIRPFGPRTGLPGTDGDLCFACHDRQVYGGADDALADATRTAFSDGQRDLHDIGKPGEGHRVACDSCHAAVVHGGTRPALLVTIEDTAPFRAADAVGVTLTAGMPAVGEWTADSCSHEGACHR